MSLLSAERITVEEVRKMQRLIKGAYLHDVGKIGITDNILLKPARLDEEEFKIMKTHVDHGVDIVVGPIAVRLFYTGSRIRPELVDPIVVLALRGISSR